MEEEISEISPVCGKDQPIERTMDDGATKALDFGDQ
jgi:hypothetical protein